MESSSRGVVMDFLTEKIVKCDVCGKEFLAIGDTNDDEVYFCSAECSENYESK